MADTGTPGNEPDAQDLAAPGHPHKSKEAEAKEREEIEVHEKSAASARVVYRAILEEAEEELERPVSALAWSGLAAGLSMGFSLVLEGLLQSRLPAQPWRALIAKLGYTFGFFVVILGRQQLFTENTLTPMLALLRRKDWQTSKKVARLWITILISNLFGAAAIAYALQRSTAFSDSERQAFLSISMESMEPGFGTLIVKSIFAGWLIALMVWMLPVAETGRIWVTIFVPYIVGLGSLSHIVIGTVYGVFTVAAHQHTWMEYFAHFALPTLLGNVIGGVTLVAVVNHAQVMAGAAEGEID